jgi:rRNA maturation RNase YbeY
MVQRVKYLKINSGDYRKIAKSSILNLINNLKSELNLNFSSFIVNFVSEEEILDINKRFLDHNYATDIITFDYSENNHSIDAELFISYREAEHNSRRFRVTEEQEITRLIIHGILHLIGFDDKMKKDRIKMKKTENELVKKYKNLL